MIRAGQQVRLQCIRGNSDVSQVIHRRTGRGNSQHVVTRRTEPVILCCDFRDRLHGRTDGVLNPADPNNSCCNNSTIGESSGQLPGTVTLINSETTNEYTEAMTFGTTITFDLFLYGPAMSTPNGEGGGTFTLDFLNADQTEYLFTADNTNDVPVFTVDITGDGSPTAMTYPSQTTVRPS